MIFLKHVEGSKRGQIEEFDLERIRVGRNPDNDLKFDPAADREVSGHHAEILCQGEQVSIRDLPYVVARHEHGATTVAATMRLASLVSKVQGPDWQRWIATEEVLEAATVGSASLSRLAA